jgi:hypothetical protein
MLCRVCSTSCLLFFPAAAPLPACCVVEVVFDLAQQEVQSGNRYAAERILGCLRKLPAAQSVGPQQLAGLLEQKLQAGAAFHIHQLCQFPAAQHIPAERMQHLLLLLLGPLLKDLFGDMAWEQLLQLPGAQAVVSEAHFTVVA